MSTPSYFDLFASGALKQRALLAAEHLRRCDLCAQECRVDRYSNVLGICRTGTKARVGGYGPHLGEEAVLSGRRGSGTIFFSRCNMRCQFCQNDDISQSDAGTLVEADGLAAIMLELQDNGCHNINLVTPSHVIAPILDALLVAIPHGLHLPLVYNTGGYDSLAGLSLLEGVIDIYLPDMKYAHQATARSYSKTTHYPGKNRLAVKEMHRQVGDLVIGEDGLAERGLLVRCLLLPYALEGAGETARFLAEEVSPHTALHLMDQYHPAYQVLTYPNQFPRLKRRITAQEYRTAVEQAQRAGLQRLL